MATLAAAAKEREPQIQKRTGGKVAERNAKVNRLYQVEHTLQMEEELNAKTPRATKPRRQGKAKVTSDFAEDAEAEEPPTPAPSKLPAKGSLRAAVDERVSKLAIANPAPSQAKGEKRKAQSSAPDLELDRDEYPDLKQGKYVDGEMEDEVPTQKGRGRGNGRGRGRGHGRGRGQGRGGAPSREDTIQGRGTIPGGKLKGGAAVWAKRMAKGDVTDDEDNLLMDNNDEVMDTADLDGGSDLARCLGQRRVSPHCLCVLYEIDRNVDRKSVV